LAGVDCFAGAACVPADGVVGTAGFGRGVPPIKPIPAGVKIPSAPALEGIEILREEVVAGEGEVVAAEGVVRFAVAAPAWPPPAAAPVATPVAGFATGPAEEETAGLPAPAVPPTAPEAAGRGVLATVESAACNGSVNPDPLFAGTRGTARALAAPTAVAPPGEVVLGTADPAAAPPAATAFAAPVESESAAGLAAWGLGGKRFTGALGATFAVASVAVDPAPAAPAVVLGTLGAVATLLPSPPSSRCNPAGAAPGVKLSAGGAAPGVYRSG